MGGTGSTPTATIGTVTWKGLRCRIQVAGEASGLRADIRTKAGEASTSVLGEPKEIAPDGQVALLVTNDALLGDPALIVLLSADGTVISKTATEIGQ